MIYMLTYDLRTPEKDYAPLFSHLEKEVGKEALHVMQNVWWIFTDNELNLDKLCDDVRQYLGSSDLLFISSMKGADNSGWLSLTSWEWLKKHL